MMTMTKHPNEFLVFICIAGQVHPGFHGDPVLHLRVARRSPFVELPARPVLHALLQVGRHGGADRPIGRLRPLSSRLSFYHRLRCTYIFQLLYNI